MGVLEYILVMSKEAIPVLVPIFIPVKSSLYLGEFFYVECTRYNYYFI